MGKEKMRNKEIAEILHITPAAVSMALNNKGGVSESKRKKIFELKYASSQSPEEKEKKKGRILFFIHVKNGNVIAETHFFVTLMSAIQERAGYYGYFADIIRYNSKTQFREFISSVNMSNVCGILVLATEIDSEDAALYRDLGKPLVMIDNWFAGEDYDCILMDNIDGIKQAVRYACHMEHRNIGFVRSKIHIHNFDERYEGFCQGMREAGLPIIRKNIFSTKCTTDGAYEDMCAIIKKTPELPSLLIISNDVMAIGIVNALKYSHYRVPKDVSVISFDNMPIARYFSPTLTTVSIQDKQIGYVSVDRLIEKIEKGMDNYFVHNLIGVRLEIRESVCNYSSMR